MKMKTGLITIMVAAALPIGAVVADPDWQGMKHGFQRMDKTMEQANKTMNVTERQKYMNEHMKMMSDQLNMMHGMMVTDGKSGMGGGMGMQGQMAGKGGMSPEYMQQRMDMMQMMMEHMLKQQGMMQNIK